MSRILSSAEEREFLAYLDALFRLDNSESVHNKLAELSVPAPYRLRIKVLYSQIAMKDVLDGLVRKGKIQHLKKEARTFLLERTKDRQGLMKLPVSFYLGSFDKNKLPENVQAIIAICKTDEWKALTLFIKNSYPHLVPILLSQSELIQSAKKIKKITGHDVNVRALSAKEAYEGKKTNYRKSVRIWTDEQLEKALLSIHDRRQTITSLDVEFFPKIGDQSHVLPSMICKIRKNGEIEATGSYEIAFDAVAEQIAEVGERKLNFFSGRGLRSSDFVPKPLAVNFVQPAFEKKETVRIFVQILSKYPNSMHAVIHGNPYAHVKLTDMLDGSSFDIWAISPSRIALMPGLKASEGAFERLVHYIFDKFREGTVADYGYEGRTLEGSAWQGQ